ETIVFGILLVGLLQLAPAGVWPWLMSWLPRKSERKRPDTSLALPARARAAGAPSVLLRIDHARKQFGGVIAVNDVSFDVRVRESAGARASMCRLDRPDEARLLAEAARQIERVGLSKEIDQPAGSLSLGQQRIVEIARALCVDPTLLLLDEPAAGLRHMEKQRLAILLRQLRDGGMSVLLVEHDMGFVMNLADRVVVLDFGTKIAEGTPQAIKTDPEVIKAYLGAAA